MTIVAESNRDTASNESDGSAGSRSRSGERERARTRRKWLSPELRHMWKRFLKLRDGPLCPMCKASESETVALQIDHKNGDANDWSEDNLRLLCASCNMKERHRLDREAIAMAYGVVSVSESFERERVEEVGGRVDFGLSLGVASAELRVNRDKEPWFRRELLWKVGTSETKSITIDAALHEISEIVNLSPVTARRYLKKMTSLAGPMVVEETRGGGRVIRLRPEYYEKQFQEQTESKKVLPKNMKPLDDYLPERSSETNQK